MFWHHSSLSNHQSHSPTINKTSLAKIFLLQLSLCPFLSLSRLQTMPLNNLSFWNVQGIHLSYHPCFLFTVSCFLLPGHPSMLHPTLAAGWECVSEVSCPHHGQIRHPNVVVAPHLDLPAFFLILSAIPFRGTHPCPRLQLLPSMMLKYLSLPSTGPQNHSHTLPYVWEACQ